VTDQEQPVDTDDPEAALRAVRLKFVTDFPTQCSAFTQFIDRTADPAAAGERTALARLAHRMAGLAGMLGLPSVSSRAKEIEELVLSAAGALLDQAAAHEAVTRLRDAFTQDLTRPAPSWAEAPTRADQPRVLVVEDDPDQQRLLLAALRQSGFAVSAADRGDEAVAAVRESHADVVLLDVDLPGTSGLDVCRALRLDAELHLTPVIFLTSRSSSADRVAGLTVGADDYVVKPVDAAELRLRITHVLQRRAAAPVTDDGILTQPVFLSAAHSALQAEGGAVALIRVPQGQTATVKAIARDARRRDLVGRYDDRHVIVLMPGVAAPVAVEILARLLAAAGTDAPLNAGVTSIARGQDLQAAIEQVDEALAEARYRRQPVVLYGTRPAAEATAAPARIVIAEDDPDVVRILDSRLQASGYQTVLAFDGKQALDAIGTSAPDMVLLDLMLPRLTGFEVLAALKKRGGPKPPIVVLSARGREEDVTRAFDLGADDYITKPFGPEELLARVARLLR
jgi:DNA-binding response OmpR family regulator